MIGSSTVNADVDRREKFHRLAETRVRKAAKALSLVGNLGNRSNYSYTPEDVRKMFNYLENELKNAKRRFDITSDSSKDSEFTF